MNKQSGRAIEIQVIESLLKRSSYPDPVRSLEEIPKFDPNVPLYEGYSYDLMVSSLLRKWKGWGQSDNAKTLAIRKWTASEAACLETNKAIRSLRDNPSGLENPRGYDLRAISRVIEKIEKVLGRFTRFKSSHSGYSECARGPRWSTGATALTKRGAEVQEKMSFPIAVTSFARKHLLLQILNDPVWGEHFLGTRPSGAWLPIRESDMLTVVSSSVLDTVPKTAEVDRVICKEPAGNAFLQQGVRQYIRKRLKRFGVDLSDQTVNQRLARFASKDGSMATLDLSAASDTISLELVWLLLPSTWAEYLDDLRSPSTLLPDGTTVKLEKFASMGNAYTFELESLIFWAIAQTLCDDVEGSSCSVFGDDIIISTNLAHKLTEQLVAYGFSINAEKSFVTGPFRESCGGYYNTGESVKPIFQKNICNTPQETIRFHNRLRRWLDSTQMFGSTITEAQKECVNHNLSLIRRYYSRHWGKESRCTPMVPRGSNRDDGFLMDVNDPEFKVRKFDPNHGFLCRVLVFKPLIKTHRRSFLHYAYKLRSPRTLNAHPRGWDAKVVRGKWIYDDLYIHDEIGISLEFDSE